MIIDFVAKFYLGFGVLLALGLWFLRAKLPSEKVEKAHSILVILLLSLIGSAVLRNVYAVKKLEASIPALTDKLVATLPIIENSEDNLAIINLNNARQQFSNGANSVMSEVLDDYVAKHYNFLENTAKYELVRAAPGEDVAIATRLIDSARSVVDATSYVQPDFWWRSKAGREYFEYNRKIIETKKVRIRRIFIIPPNSSEDSIRDLLDCNALAGVETFVAHERDITGRNREDVIIIDGTSVAGRLDLDSELRTLFSEFSSDRDFVNSQVNSFEAVLKQARGYDAKSDRCDFLGQK